MSLTTYSTKPTLLRPIGPKSSESLLPRIIGCNVFVTLNCNLGCSYCYVSKDGRSMDLTTADHTVELMARFSQAQQGQFHFGFLGGEPLLRFDLIKHIVKRMRNQSQRDISFGLTTNGTLLQANILEWLVANGIRVVLSFDGVPEAMAARSFKNSQTNSYERVVRGMRALQASGANYLIQMTVTENNVSHFARSVVHAIELGNNDLIFGFAISDKWMIEQRDIMVDQFKQIIDLYRSIYRFGASTTFKFIKDEIICYLLYSRTYSSEYCCAMADQVLAVSIDGHLYPCQAFVNFPEMSFGDVRSGVNVNRLNNMPKGRVDLLPECRKCLLRGFCRKCPAANYALAADVNDVAAISCSLSRVTYALIEDFVRDMLAENNLRFLDEFGPCLAVYFAEPHGMRQPFGAGETSQNLAMQVLALTDWKRDIDLRGKSTTPDIDLNRLPSYVAGQQTIFGVGDGRAPIVEFGAYRAIEIEEHNDNR